MGREATWHGENVTDFEGQRISLSWPPLMSRWPGESRSACLSLYSVTGVVVRVNRCLARNGYPINGREETCKNREKVKDRGDDVGKWHNVTKNDLGISPQDLAFIWKNWSLPRAGDTEIFERISEIYFVLQWQVIRSIFFFFQDRECRTYLKYWKQLK